jgi:DNA-binding transcriptional ArsR family regulator
VHNTNTQPEGFSPNRKSDLAPAGARYICQNHSASHPSEIRNQVISFHNPRHQGRIQAITHHSGLILDLKAIQPASLSEIAEEVGQSTSSVRNHLKRLTQLDLVVRVAFEHHTLYCLNGDYNVHIDRILGELYG